MKIKIIILILFILSLFVSLTFPLGNSHAENNYRVKGGIIVPSNWKNFYSPDELETMKLDIIRGLTEVQEFYKNNLDGHTFLIDQEVEIFYSQKPYLGPVDRVEEASIAYRDLEINKIIEPVDPFITHVLFIVGTGDVYQSGGGQIAILNHKSLLALSDEASVRNVALGSIAHELGHALGLVFAGWATAHPCTEVTPYECLEGAPDPLPDKRELFESVIGHGISAYPNVSFNNSEYNPEKCKLFESPFINPQNDPCPPIQPSLLPTFSVFDVNPTSVHFDVMSGYGTLTIQGSGFGRKKGRVIFYNIDSGATVEVNDLLWFPTEIMANLNKKDFEPYGTAAWRVTTILEDGKKVEYPYLIVIWGEKFQRISSQITFSVSAKVTCGTDYQPIPGMIVNLYLYQPNGESTIVAQSTADESGIASLSYALESPVDGQTISVAPSNARGLYPHSSQRVSIHENLPSLVSMNPILHYSNCSQEIGRAGQEFGSFLFIPTPSPTPEEQTVLEEEEEDIESDDEEDLGGFAACEQNTFVGCGACGFDRFACADGSNVIELPNQGGDCGRPEFNDACEVPPVGDYQSPSSDGSGACEDVYYPDPNINEETNPTGCIHKYSPEPYPNCNYLFDPVYDPEKSERCVE